MMDVIASIGTTHPFGVAGLTLAQSLVRELGARSVCVVAGVTAQDAERVYARHPIDAATIRSQFSALRTAGITAAHVGALLDINSVNAVSNALDDWGEIPLVCDPVIAATGGDSLADSRTQHAIRDRLFKRATLVTPNLDEARMYLGTTIDSLEGMQIAAREFGRFGAQAVLLKGGHLAERAIDVLWYDGTIAIFDDERLPYEVRGTGDMLAAAITVALARGNAVPDAVIWARRIVRAKIAGGVDFAGMRVAE